MIRKILFWLARFGKGHILVSVKPVIVQLPGGSECLKGELTFANSWLRFLRREKFCGLKELRKLSTELKRPISFFVPRNVELDCEGCFTIYEEITDQSDDNDLERIAGKINEDLAFVALSDNPYSPLERLNLIYV